MCLGFWCVSCGSVCFVLDCCVVWILVVRPQLVAELLRHTGLTAAGTTACDNVLDFPSDLFENLFLLLVPQFLSKSAQPFLCAVRVEVESQRLQAMVTCLRPVLRIRPATQPDAEIFFG